MPNGIPPEVREQDAQWAETRQRAHVHGCQLHGEDWRLGFCQCFGAPDRLAELSRAAAKHEAAIATLRKALAEYDAAHGRFPNQRHPSRVIAAAREMLEGTPHA